MVVSGLPMWLSGKGYTYQAGDAGSVPGSRRSPGGGNGNPPQYSSLANPTDREPGELQCMGSYELDTT